MNINGDSNSQVNEISETSTDGSVYIKVFGNELKFVTLEDIKNMEDYGMSMREILDKVRHLLRHFVHKQQLLR